MATNTAKDIEIAINGLTEAQAALLTWVDIDDEYIKKDPSKRDWWDKAFWNTNPDLKEKNKAYHEYANRISDLQSRLTNLQSAEQYMTDIVSENKDRINKIYDLQNKAAALSAWIQWTNRVAWWLWAASNVINNSQWITDATLRQNVAQNEAARQTALLNNAQQALNIPSTLASIWQANAQIAYQNALTGQIWKENSYSWSSYGWYSYSSRWNNKWNNEDKDIKIDIPESQLKTLEWKDVSWNADWISWSTIRNWNKRYFWLDSDTWKLKWALDKYAPDWVKK